MPSGPCCWQAAPSADCVAPSKSSRIGRPERQPRLWLATEPGPSVAIMRCGSGCMKIAVLTLFPGMFAGPLDKSIVRRARDAGLLELSLHQLRDYAHDRHKTVDDRPFGGGPGMLLKPEPIFEAVEAMARPEAKVSLMSPSGRPFNQAIARELAQEKDLLLVTGHY